MATWESNKKEAEAGLQRVNDLLNPGEKQEKGNSKPYYATGSRCFIKMAGKPLGICQDFKWSVSYNTTPITTIDTVFPWDLDVGQAQISATLTKIIDPLRGPEADSLFTVMSAAVHQPMVELQVIYRAMTVDASSGSEITNEAVVNRTDYNGDTYQEVGRSGTGNFNKKTMIPMEFSMFFARGMFTSVSGNATVGQLSSMNATFMGVAYQHYVSQAFVPYGLSYIAQERLDKLQDFTSAASGGFA